MQETQVQSLVGRRPSREGNGNPLSILAGKIHEQMSLVGVHGDTEESDTT